MLKSKHCIFTTYTSSSYSYTVYFTMAYISWSKNRMAVLRGHMHAIYAWGKYKNKHSDAHDLPFFAFKPNLTQQEKVQHAIQA